MFAVILDGLERADVVVISGDQNGGVIIVFKAVRQKVGGKLDVNAFFVGRRRRPVVIDEVSQPQFGIGHGADSGEKRLLVFKTFRLLAACL